MRLIDADKLKKIFSSIDGAGRFPNAVIDAMPTIEVEDEQDEEVNEFTCPFCGDVTYTATDYVPRFCQECGRHMGFRGGRK